MKIFDSMTKKIQWHTTVKFLKNFSDDKLLKNDKNNQKNENSSTKIFDDENENEKNENVETQIFRKQSISDVADDSKLIKNNSFDSNRENRENHVISINQKTKKSKNFAIFIQLTRRSTRNSQLYDRYRYDNEFEQKIQIFNFSSNQKFEFATYNETINCPNQRLWKTVINEQLNALTANEIWKLIERSKNVENVIISKWIFKMKYIFTKKIDRYKTRLIVRNFNQMQNIDYNEIFLSTLRLKSLQMLLAFAAHFDYEIKQINVSNAYFKKKFEKNYIYKNFWKLCDFKRFSKQQIK